MDVVGIMVLPDLRNVLGNNFTTIILVIIIVMLNSLFDMSRRKLAI